MTDLVAFLRARLDDDERTAREASAGPWKVNDIEYAEYIKAGDDLTDVVAGGRWGGEASVFESTEDAIHIARHDPARVLAEVAAKRELISEIQYFEARIDGEWGVGTGTKDVDSALRYLAVPYAEHPDFDPAWTEEAM